MISLRNFVTMDTETLLYAFLEQLQQHAKAGKLDHLTDEQADLIENNIILDIAKVLEISQQTITD